MGPRPFVKIFLGLAGLSLLGCASTPKAGPHAGVTKVTTVARSTMAGSDGVAIAYEVRGSGDVALVFVHCWACDRSYWTEQLEVFDDDYQVVAMDLPGHGASGRREEGTILELGSDVARLVRTLGLERVILVGHSMGGPVSLRAAKILSGTAVGVIGLDTLHNAENKPPEGTLEEMALALENDYEGVMESLVRSAFPKDADADLVGRLVVKAQKANAAVAIELLRDFPRLDLPALFREAGVPIRCINAAPRGDAGTATEVGVNQRYADFDAEIVGGVGHFLQLESPLEINARIRRRVEELLTD